MYFCSYSRTRRREKGPSNFKVNGRTNHHKAERENLDENVELKKECGLEYSGHNSIQHTGEGECMERLAREY